MTLIVVNVLVVCGYYKVDKIKLKYVDDEMERLLR